MRLWEIVNSPIALTVTSFVFGGLMVSWLSARWQQRAQLHELRVANARDMLTAYQDYIRVIRGRTMGLNGPTFDTVHAQLLATAKVASFLFANAEVGASWQSIAGKLAAIHDCRLREQDDRAKRLLKEVYKAADQAMSLMFKELR